MKTITLEVNRLALVGETYVHRLRVASDVRLVYYAAIMRSTMKNIRRSGHNQDH